MCQHSQHFWPSRTKLVIPPPQKLSQIAVNLGGMPISMAALSCVLRVVQCRAGYACLQCANLEPQGTAAVCEQRALHPQEVSRTAVSTHV